MNMTTISPTEIEAVRAALTSPDLIIGHGVGDADTPGQGTACTIAEINLALTGRLTDDLHPCMSPVIRSWVIRIQDAMPSKMRNSKAWREAAIGIAGSAASHEVEQKRAALILEWMWGALGDQAVLAAVPAAARTIWESMMRERSAAAAAAAAAPRAADVAAAYAATYAATRAAEAASAAAFAAAEAAEDVAATRAATRAAEAASAAAFAASAAASYAASASAVAYAEVATFHWERLNPAALLSELVAAAI